MKLIFCLLISLATFGRAHRHFTESVWCKIPFDTYISDGIIARTSISDVVRQFN